VLFGVGAVLSAEILVEGATWDARPAGSHKRISRSLTVSLHGIDQIFR
jgi:hypothetical protein